MSIWEIIVVCWIPHKSHIAISQKEPLWITTPSSRGQRAEQHSKPHKMTTDPNISNNFRRNLHSQEYLTLKAVKNPYALFMGLPENRTHQQPDYSLREILEGISHYRHIPVNKTDYCTTSPSKAREPGLLRLRMWVKSWEGLGRSLGRDLENATADSREEGGELEEAGFKSQKEQIMCRLHHAVTEESERHWCSIFIIVKSWFTSQMCACPEQTLAQLLLSAAHMKVCSQL